ncbi:MAG: response regulator [Nitrospira sp.]|nr:response regulator [bacterium]MBL7048402.1 response regulator [Nitrospira sp.]
MATSQFSSSDVPMEILFVDDEKNILSSLKRLFMYKEYIINLANSGEEGLEILKNNPHIGIVVSDQRMPYMSGVDFLEKVRELAPDTLRILLTGYADIEAVADAINRGGAYRYIAKPWKDEEMVQVIAEAVKRHSLVKENKNLQIIVARQNQELKKWNAELEIDVQQQSMEIQNKNDKLQELNRNLQKSFKHTIMAFAGLIDLRDISTGNHSHNVAEIAVAIARQMELPAGETEAISIAALLHDIGKIGMPDNLLKKNLSDMNEYERAAYEKHSVLGQNVVKAVDHLAHSGLYIRNHHELYDGSGFPDKLQGESIPQGSRIIAYADYYERAVYGPGKGRSIDSVLKIISAARGSRFDPLIFSAFKEVIRSLPLKV